MALPHRLKASLSDFGFVFCLQRGAGNMGGFVPATWQKTLAPFMDQIPPRDFETVGDYLIEDTN